MRSRKLKKLLSYQLLSVKIIEVGLSKIDFSKFLCYNIYRKMREKKVISQKSSLSKNYDNQLWQKSKPML